MSWPRHLWSRGSLGCSRDLEMHSALPRQPLHVSYSPLMPCFSRTLGAGREDFKEMRTGLPLAKSQ